MDDIIYEYASDLSSKILDEFDSDDVNKLITVEDWLRKYAKDIIDEYDDTSSNKS